MAIHAENTLRRPCISQVLDLPLAIATLETIGTEGLVASQYGEVFDLVVAAAATVSTTVAYERAIAEEKEVGVGVEEGATGVAAEAINVPSVPRCRYQSVTACVDGRTRWYT